MRRYKFKKELSQFEEIKGSKSPKNVTLYTLKKMNNLENSQIFISFLDKKNSK
ncbi:MAG: hypothetical protein ACRCVG_05085 [Methanobacteriaceae archaeon]